MYFVTTKFRANLHVYPYQFATSDVLLTQVRTWNVISSTTNGQVVMFSSKQAYLLNRLTIDVKLKRGSGHAFSH